MDVSLSELGSWWWTGRPGVLRFLGSQRVGHDWAPELNWIIPRELLLLLFCPLHFPAQHQWAEKFPKWGKVASPWAWHLVAQVRNASYFSKQLQVKDLKLSHHPHSAEAKIHSSSPNMLPLSRWGSKFGKLCDFNKLERDDIIIVDIHEYIKLYWIIYVKWVNSVICELYPIKAVFLVCLSF